MSGTPTVNIEIDGRKLQVAPGTLLIEAARGVGITIPHFCYHDKLSVAANCRMCLVEIEKMPKPMPACATRVTEGMRVFTRSEKARDAQKGTMEFLLINHPLDCPVCDQGGECPLQDQAVGYGGDVSRFAEAKRVVEEHDIGPLVATEMTRCIHCTRCVRFGREIAGIMEMGAPGRGEHTEIGTFLGETVSSELSGNMIDLCPVGALTSRPYRFSARSWELKSMPSVAPHDCLGSNLLVQSVRGAVKRVLPRENDDVNECWLSDRDRFGYEAVNHPDRLRAPKIRVDGRWKEADWETALRAASDGFKRVRERHGSEELAALVSPLATVEEGYLAQKLMRALGSSSVDHRLRQKDFRDDELMPAYPALNVTPRELEQARAVLLVGSNLRKEQPLLALRVRKAWQNGAAIMALNSLDYEFNFDLAHKCVMPPSQLPYALGRIALSLYGPTPAPIGLRAWGKGTGTPAEEHIAHLLAEAGSRAVIVLGQPAQAHTRYSLLRTLLQIMTEHRGARLAVLPEGNGAGLCWAGCLPHRGPGARSVRNSGRNVPQMFQYGTKAYLLLGAEPELDCLEGDVARSALEAAEFVVALTPFDTSARTRADVLLPSAPFTENEGSFLNSAGQMQSYGAAVPLTGEARPAWKILRVLGNHLDLSGFEQMGIEDVRREIPAPGAAGAGEWRLIPHEYGPEPGANTLERVFDVPPYRVDPLVRRAASLQATADNPAPAVHINARTAEGLDLTSVARVAVLRSDQSVPLPLVRDERVPDWCAYIPGGHAETLAVGDADAVRLMKLS
jgi:NADH-quinone oxidoreductase subunit G